jgi:tetratricopeptide (TPR) repeat protein
VRALVVVALFATAASADEQAFRAATDLAGMNDPRARREAIDAFEAAGAARPVSRWSDDAWAEAARLAELARDYDRARRDLEQAIAISSDATFLRRARGDLARLQQLTGGGEWSAIAAEHQRLATDIGDGGDPTRALEQLEVVAKANPKYPRAVAMRVTLARAWETEDEVERGLGWLREAVQLAPAEDHPRIELVRMLVRNRELADARRELALIRDVAARRTLERSLSAGESWEVLRWISLAILIVLGVVAAVVLRRRRMPLRQLARPPVEVIYFVPIAAVVGAIASTGNPLVAKAVIWIFVGAALIAWVSGATLEAARRRAAIGVRHAVIHAFVVGVAVLAAVYLAIDHARLLDLVAETWRTGPGH